MHVNASTSALINSYKNLKGIHNYVNITGETVFLESDWSRNISYGIFNLAATLNPQKILIDGGISTQKGLFSNIINQLDKIHLWNEIKIPVESCKHHNDAGMLGAMYHLR